MKVILFDTETTGLPTRYNAPVSAMENWPRVVQLAYDVYEYDKDSKIFTHLRSADHIIKPFGFSIPAGASNIHKTTTERAHAEGLNLVDVLQDFKMATIEPDAVLVAHNMDFDYPVIAAEFYRLQVPSRINAIRKLCTMKSTTDLVAIKKAHGGGNKWPKLVDLHSYLFKEGFDGAHNAAADVAALSRCFIQLIKDGVKLRAGDYTGE